MGRKLTARDFILVGALVVAAGLGVMLIRNGKSVSEWAKSKTKIFNHGSKGDSGLETAASEDEGAESRSPADADTFSAHEGGANTDIGSSASRASSKNLASGIPAPVRPKGPLAPRPSKNESGQCVSVEYPGYGPVSGKFTEEEWSKVKAVYDAVKANLTSWLRAQKSVIPDATYKVMASQLQNVSLWRSPNREELDLAWRGILVYTQDAKHASVRVGSGFRDLVLNDNHRAKFEMARALSQSLVPCSLISKNVKQPWGPLLSCLGLDSEESCNVGSYSEAGWAISTTLAAASADPGCKVIALESDKAQSCIASLKNKGWAVTQASSVKPERIIMDQLTINSGAKAMGRAE
jgi:hypothetical protein